MSKDSKFVPYEKMSKKDKKEVDQRKRSVWGSLNPVTRSENKSCAYDRNKEKRGIRSVCNEL